jgi:uncharacterized protein (TIGR02145 family)
MRHQKVKVSVALFWGIAFMSLQAQSVKDIDGNIYQTVTIGSQTWMKENLKVTHYRNGDAIETTPFDTSGIITEIEPKYQWAYEGKASNADVYGRLYTWYAVTDSRSVCPTGWHVPAYTEWATLIDFLGGRSVAVGKLRKPGGGHWYSPDSAATNETGFTALASGQRRYNGVYKYKEYFCGWWSSTDGSLGSKSSIFNLNLGNFGMPLREHNEESMGIPVRCLKD